jgi:cellulose synthase/poly-beta-1,6-N-acetylglucosamine synthase-like glycosyltransferase
MKVTIVIPVYNEAAHLGACLEAIAVQAVTPYEVIVVDNNSTDNTAAIARSYGFVTLLSEKRQGVVHARNRGFDAAAGDIIGRIDADTLLPPDWVAQLQGIFQDESVSAVSGAPHYYDFALAGLADAIDLYLRLRLARRLKDTNFLWGANMAIRRSAWLQARPLLCSHRSLHEDFDLAIHLQSLGQQVVYDESLVAGVSSRRIDSGFVDYVRYTLASPRTYAAHRLRSRYHMYPVLAVCWLGYLPGHLIYRSYNPETGSFSLSQLLAAGSSRVDPTTNVA